MGRRTQRKKGLGRSIAGANKEGTEFEKKFDRFRRNLKSIVGGGRKKKRGEGGGGSNQGKKNDFVYSAIAHSC